MAATLYDLARAGQPAGAQDAGQIGLHSGIIAVMPIKDLRDFLRCMHDARFFPG